MRPAIARGLSIVELMIGIAISLFILAGATLVLTSQMDSNRRLLLEAQLQQDLRTTADMISRDIRRAGYWSKAYCDVWPGRQDAVNCAVANPYTTMSPASAPASAPVSEIVYDRSTDHDYTGRHNSDDNRLDSISAQPRERVGFRHNEVNGSIEYRVGANNWQTLTDPGVMRVTAFDIVVESDVLPLATCGQPGCQVLGPCDGPLSMVSRNVTFTIVAEAVHDDTVQRSLRENVRLRNSIPVDAACP